MRFQYKRLFREKLGGNGVLGFNSELDHFFD